MCIYAVFSYNFDQAIQDTIMCAILFDFMSFASIRLGKNIINGIPLETAKDKLINELFAQAKFAEIFDICQGMKAIIHSIQPMTLFSAQHISGIIINPINNTEINTAYSLLLSLSLSSLLLSLC